MKTKKRPSPPFGTIFGRNLWDLFVLTGPFSSDHLTLKPQWRDIKSRWGTLNRDGGTLTPDGGTRPFYNLSTV